MAAAGRLSHLAGKGDGPRPVTAAIRQTRANGSSLGRLPQLHLGEGANDARHHNARPSRGGLISFPLPILAALSRDQSAGLGAG